MPAVSQQQQKIMGLALSVKRGETPRSEVSADVLKIVDSMSEKDLRKYAGTSHTGLPKTVEAKIREMVRELYKEMKSVNEEKVYIDYLNKKKGFKKDRITFNSYEEAVKWAKKNFEKFNPDMIQYESVNEGKFKVDDLVYNKRTKTVGIVRMGDDRYGEVKTDADGNVSVDELEKYNPIKFKHQSKAKVAPSTEKEINSRGLFNPFKAESVNEEKVVTKKEWDRIHKDFKGMVNGKPHMMYLDPKTDKTVYGPVTIKESK